MYSAQYQTCRDVHKTNSGANHCPCHEDAIACSLLNSYDRGEQGIQHKHRCAIKYTQENSPRNSGLVDNVMDYVPCHMVLDAKNVQRT